MDNLISNSVTKLLNIDQEFLLFSAIFLFLWLTLLWDAYLDSRQKSVLESHDKLPAKASVIMTQDQFSRARSYSIDNRRFESYSKLYHIAESSIVLLADIIPRLWRISASIVTRDQRELSTFEELNASMVCLLLMTLYSFVTGLPWKYYHTFVIEAKHGFNKQSRAFFLKDQLKALAISIVLMLPISYGLLAVIKWGGPHFYVYAWAFAFLATVFLMFIYPEFIAPLFDKYTPLDDGPLKTSIEKLAARIEFPLKKIYVVDGSKRSSHSNAYLYGFWKNKRIVLFDTLLKDLHGKSAESEAPDQARQGCSDEEVVAILGHELGHWKLSHVLKGLVVTQLNIFMMLFTFGFLFNWDVLFRTFGFAGPSTPTMIRLFLIFRYLFSPYNFVVEFLLTCWSRKNEFEADNFAASLDYGDQLKDALIKIHNDNLSFPLFDRLYSMFNHSHPPVLERLRAIDDYEKKK